MNDDGKYQPRRQSAVLNVVIVLIILVWTAGTLFSLYGRSRTTPVNPCQSNLKQLAIVIQMYWSDYDGVLPSSALRLRATSNVWDPMESAMFCAQRGTFPVPQGTLAPEQIHWYQLLWPHMKNKDIVWCPSDPNKTVGNSPSDQAVLVSYFYRPAVDRAWFGSMSPAKVEKPDKNLVMKSFRKESDFDYVTDQIVFFERLGWHWGDRKKGWRDSVSLNCAFMDGHVRNVRLKNAVGRDAPDNVGEFSYTISEPGEPMWYNYEVGTGELSDGASYTGHGKYDRGRFFDPRRYIDNLP